MRTSPRLNAALTPILALCLQLAAEGASVKIWNGDPLASHTDILGYDEAGPAGAVRIVGARNGYFSGKVVVGAEGPLRGVSASVTDLRQNSGRGRIAAADIMIRYAKKGPWSSWQRVSKAVNRYDALAEAPPAEVPPLAPGRRPNARESWIKMGRAVLPIWITVHVPDHAAPGEYKGTLTISVGGGSTRLPVELKVCPYRVPDPRDFRTWAELIQSPDSLALEYGVPLWSDRHWKLMDRSMEYLAAAGTRTCYVPLICETNLGNAESMVRWKRSGSSYSYDFSIMEKYLDMYERHIGKPQIIVFYVWDVFLEGGRFAGDIKYESKETQAQRLAYKGKGPEVTLAGGGKEMLPQHSDPKSRSVWSPLVTELRSRMAKRGLAKAMALGMADDSVPTAEAVATWKQLLPGVAWVRHAHGTRKDLHGVPYCYQLGVWGIRFANPGQTGKQHGWKLPELKGQFARDLRSNFPIHSFRYGCEMNIGGTLRGMGRLGCDFWPSVKDKRGRRVGYAYDRFPKANWRNLNVACSLTEPGPEGAIGTARYEMFREGIQECEARIAIDAALVANRISGALAERCRTILAERDRAMIKTFNIKNPDDYRANFAWYCSPGGAGEDGIMWHARSDWLSRSEKLYAAAYEAAKIADPASQKARSKPDAAPKAKPSAGPASRPAAPKRAPRVASERSLDQKLAGWMRMAKSARANGADALARTYLQRILKEAPAGSPVRSEAKEMLGELK